MEYRIRIESSQVAAEDWDNYSDELIERLRERLPDAGVIGFGRVGHTLGATMMFDAPTGSLEYVAVAGEHLLVFFDSLVEIAGPDAVIVHHEVELADYEPPSFVGASDVGKILDVSRQRVYQLMLRPDFPKPSMDLGRGQVWDRRDIEAFAEKERVAGRPRGTRTPVEV